MGYKIDKKELDKEQEILEKLKELGLEIELPKEEKKDEISVLKKNN